MDPVAISFESTHTHGAKAISLSRHFDHPGPTSERSQMMHQLLPNLTISPFTRTSTFGSMHFFDFILTLLTLTVVAADGTSLGDSVVTANTNYLASMPSPTANDLYGADVSPSPADDGVADGLDDCSGVDVTSVLSPTLTSSPKRTKPGTYLHYSKSTKTPKGTDCGPRGDQHGHSDLRGY